MFWFICHHLWYYILVPPFYAHGYEAMWSNAILKGHNYNLSMVTGYPLGTSAFYSSMQEVLLTEIHLTVLNRTTLSCFKELEPEWNKMLSCHADLCTVSRFHTRGESEDYTGEKAMKQEIHSRFETADATRSLKWGYQWPTKRTFVLQNFF